jgi:hypothetical protein
MPASQVPNPSPPEVLTTATAAITAAEQAKETKQANLKAAAASEAKTRRIVEGGKAPVLPDCCNIGIALRILVAVNVATIFFALVVSQSWVSASRSLVEAFAFVEPVLLISMALTCFARRAFNGMLNGRQASVQWAVGIAIPCTVMVLYGVFVCLI